MEKRGELNTEQQNPRSMQIDSMDIKSILKTINHEDSTVAIAVKNAIPDIERAVDYTIKSVKNGGRIFYIGAGTSGRLGVLDASEIPPTYSMGSNIFIGLIAGGDEALKKSIEGAEDSREDAIKDLRAYDLSGNDTIIGISCSGAAAYVVSALNYSKLRGARTIYLVTNPSPFLMADSDVVIHADTGPEIITGSTRMKAGTATKMILNMISTTTMIKLGKVYKNLMVDLMAVNKKLIDRGARIIEQLTDLDSKGAIERLESANYSVKTALVMELKDCDIFDAKRRLANEDGFLRCILEEL